MKHLSKVSALVALAIGSITMTGCQAWDDIPEKAQLKTVIDGDTIVVSDAEGDKHVISVAGLDTPERQTNIGAAEYGAQESAEKMFSLLKGRELTLYKTQDPGPKNAPARRIMVGETDVTRVMLGSGLGRLNETTAEHDLLEDYRRAESSWHGPARGDTETP